MEERRGAGLLGRGANGDKEMSLARIGWRELQVQIRGLRAGRGNRLEAEAADVILKVQRNRGENGTEDRFEFLIFKLMDMERVGADLLPRLGVVQLIRRGDNELAAARQQPLRFLKQGSPVGEMFDHLEAGDETKGGVMERNGVRRSNQETKVGQGVR